MQRPDGFDEAQVQGDREHITSGGHILQILKAEEMTSSKQKPMLKIMFDVVGNDPQAGMFKKQYDADTRTDKKWPYEGTQWIVVEDNYGKCSSYFKTFVTYIEKSNPGFTFPYGDRSVDELRGKRFGGVYGQVECMKQDKTGTFIRTELRWMRAADDVKDAPVPSVKYLSEDAKRDMQSQSGTSSGGGGSNGSYDDLNDLPFL